MDSASRENERTVRSFRRPITTFTLLSYLTPDINENDDLTVEALQRKREEPHEHGLQDTALGEAVDERIKDEEEQAKRRRLVSTKILPKQTEQQGLGDDDIEALRADVHDLENEIEAEVLTAE